MQLLPTLLLATAAATRALSASCTMPFASRSADRVVLSREQGEGAGARVRRSIGSVLRNFDPFLMLDEFKVGAPAGFPDHPHRGFETVTYMIDGGSFKHEDSKGNAGTIGPGDLQWMTAGKGILHSEMPHGGGEAHGLQMWINLPAAHKMDEPQYQEIPAASVPRVTEGGRTAIVISGSALGVTSSVRNRTPCTFVHFILEGGSAPVDQAIPAGYNAFVYVLKGEADISGRKVGPHNTVTLTVAGDGVTLGCVGPETTEVVLIAAMPIGEPIVQHGPFVMNTREEIMEAFDDYQNGRNGFEGSDTWYSQIGLPITHADKRRR